MSKKPKPKAIPAEDLRDEFLRCIRSYCKYWAEEKRTPEVEKKLEGLAFSILTLIDGHTDAMTAMDIVMRPHPSDKAFHVSQGEDWIKAGTVINRDCILHELFYNKDNDNG
jgi:hypothetical protein